MRQTSDITKMISNLVIGCLCIISLVSCIEINLNEGWTIRNKNGSKYTMESCGSVKTGPQC